MNSALENTTKMVPENTLFTDNFGPGLGICLSMSASQKDMCGVRDYLAGFEDDLDTRAPLEQLREKVLCRYSIEPNGTWLRELVDTDDWIVTAWFDLDESMSCEHTGCVSRSIHRRVSVFAGSLQKRPSESCS